jgi:hypothetical protein
VQASDAPAFLATLKRLTLTLGGSVDDARAMAYFEDLRDLPLGDFEEAARRLSRTGSRFPRPGEIRGVCEAVRAESMFRLPSAPVETNTIHCDDCEDGGWWVYTCPGIGREAATAHDPRQRYCGRTHDHYWHRCARECPCRPTNPNYQRKQQEVAAKAAEHHRGREQRSGGGGWTRATDADWREHA